MDMQIIGYLCHSLDICIATQQNERERFLGQACQLLVQKIKVQCARTSKNLWKVTCTVLTFC